MNVSKISNQKSHIVLMLVTLCLVTGFVVRAISLIAERLDYDIYFMLRDLDKPYSEYIKSGGFSPVLMTYWFLFSRFFGNEIIGYRFVPFVVNVCTIFALYFGCRRVWRDNLYISVLSTTFLGYNFWLAYTVDYPVIGYSIEPFLGCLIFFVFLEFSFSDNVSVKKICLFSFLILPLVILCSYTIAVPACAGFATVFLWQSIRCLQNRDNWERVTSVLKLSPLVIIPFVQFLSWKLYPFRFLGDSLPKYMYPLFFNRSGYPQTSWGAIDFAINNSKILIRRLILPVSNDFYFAFLDIPQWPFYGILFASVAISYILLYQRKRIDPRMSFSLLYVGISWSAVFFGGLASKFPYGTPRYIGWLIPPVCLLLGYIFSEWLFALERTFGRNLRKELFVCLLIIAILLLPTYAYATFTERSQNLEAIGVFNKIPVDKVLYSGFVENVIAVHSPKVFREGVYLGFGLYLHPNDTESVGEAYAAFRIATMKGDYRNILIVAQSEKQFLESHPTWHDYISKNYARIRDVKGSQFWVSEYRLR
jgi:hypothetical protein